MKKSIDLNDCQTLDEQDPLRSLRAKFSQSESGAIHYDANSMGAMPKAVPEQVAWMLNEGWRNLSRQGWSKLDWLDKPKKLAAGIAGCEPGGCDRLRQYLNQSLQAFELCVANPEGGQHPVDRVQPFPHGHLHC